MRAAARTMLIIICGAGAIAAASRPSLPPTPGYWPQIVGEQATRPQTITAGAQWHTETYQTVSGAQRAQVMNIDLTNPNVRFGAVEAGDQLIDPADETISSMATRTGAVAEIGRASCRERVLYRV